METLFCKNGHERTHENTYVYPDGIRIACRICRREASNRYRAHNIEKKKRYFQERYKRRRLEEPLQVEVEWQISSWKRQGIEITPSQYMEMLINQAGLCALCGKPPFDRRLDVDHDHRTGKIRGLIHRRCNLILGNADDDPSLLQAAAHYLSQPRY